MGKFHFSLGLMSGTSADGVDASVIQSDGDYEYKVILDKYFKYNQDIYENIHNLKDKINNTKDLRRVSRELKDLEKKITLFNVKLVKKIINNCKENIDLIGFHGQTIFHSPKDKISKQLGDAKLLSKITKKIVINNFRQNDLKYGGQGAPLAPIFHKMLARRFKITPITFLNIGGIANITNVYKDYKLSACDVGPGMCLVDKWVRLNSKKRYDVKGSLAKSGKINQLILNKALKNFTYKKNKSYDIKDFNPAFVDGLSLSDGAATLTEYTAKILIRNPAFSSFKKKVVIVCGGGRKNKFLIERIKKNNINIKFIDDFNLNGDFIESQAFAYLAIRSYLKAPISFPNTTGVKKPCTGGVIIKN